MEARIVDSAVSCVTILENSQTGSQERENYFQDWFIFSGKDDEDEKLKMLH
jgi:hypothetical protein